MIGRLAPRGGVTEVSVTEEDEYFPPPRSIRALQGAIEAAATAMLGGSLLGSPSMEDRAVAASSVLEALTPPRGGRIR